MTIPAWILDIFAAIMLVVAAVSAARLVAARPWRRGRGAVASDIDVAHLLMAIAMAGTLAAGLRTLPNDAWDVIFAVLTAWFAYHVVRDARGVGIRALSGGRCAPHLVHSAAMLYMFVAVTAPAAAGGSGMSGMGGSGMPTLSLPFLAFVFALILIGYSIWDLDQLSGPGASGHYSLAAARTALPGAVLAGTPAPVGAGSPAVAFSGLAPAEGGVATITPPAGPDRAAPSSLAQESAGREVLAAWVATSCRIAMGVTMALMLIIMI